MRKTQKKLHKKIYIKNNKTHLILMQKEMRETNNNKQQNLKKSPFKQQPTAKSML